MDRERARSPIIPEESGQQNVSGRMVRDVPPGILRLDIGKPRRLSAEFKPNQKEIISPQPSVDRLSVTFAEDSLKSDSSKGNLNLPPKMQQLQQQQSVQYQQERVQFPEESIDGNESDEDDYSASVNAIIQRRASTRRSKKQSRRASSPFLPGSPGAERRRSSVFTTSSGDTAITIDDNVGSDVTQDEIFENIKLHKEVLSHVKMQPWSIRKKLKLVLQAKSYIKKHEGQLQERLAQSHSTKDMLARWNIVLIKKWQKWKRELTNMSMWFIPWELKIKEIESHFGSVVASYFIFLRWLFWVNIVIAVVIISFVTIPEIITADPEAVKDRKFVLPEEKYNSTNFLTLWDFEGVFKYSPLFYGWYTNRDYNESVVFNSFDGKNLHGHGYRLPFAYFVTGLVVYAYSFFATLRKMAENSRMSKLSEKDDECIFSWKLFTAWDYMIGNAETAHNRVASIVMGFKEALLEEAEKKRESRNWKVICFRVLVNTLVAGLLSCSAFAVVIVVKRSTEPEANSNVWRRNEITVVMSLITLFFPMLFEVLGFVEQYHPRKQLRLQLARIMVLNLLNLYSLIFALFDKITDMTHLLQEIKSNLSKPQPTDVTTPISFELTPTYSNDLTSTIQCFCNDSSTAAQTVISLDMLSNLAQNLSTLATPALNRLIKSSFSFNVTATPSAFFEESFLNTTESFTTSAAEVESNFTYYYENSSNWYENVTNDVINLELSANDVKDFFVDYLAFILSSFISSNSTELSTMINTNFSVNDSLTTDSVNLSFTDYDYFKSTLMPLFNNTLLQEEKRFDMELTSLFDEISTTISSLPDIFSTSFTDTTTDNTDYYYCENYCKIIRDSKAKTWTSTPASTAMTTVSYGEVEYRRTLNYSMNANLRRLCWETMFGQELIKLTVMDLIVTGLSILMMDFFRGIFVRVMNRCWCWDLEKKFPQYGDFKVAENILHLVNNQGMVWMGMFFSPGLVVLNVVKLYILMYLRAWAVLTCNVPHEIIFRASRSNNFYYALLLMMLFLCVLPVGYAIVSIEPSWHCGPFSGYQKIFHIFTKTIRANVPESMHSVLDYIASPGIVIPLLLLLVLIIYYLISLTGALREANNDLKTQLRRERTEERRKMFQLADRRRRGGSGESNDQTPFSKWKKLLGTLPSTRSCDDTRQESEDVVPSQRDEEEEVDEKSENKGKVFFTKLIKKALGKSSTSEEEQDGTDTDQHDSLPYDNSRQPSKEHKALAKTSSEGSKEMQAFQSIVSKWSLRRNSHKDEKEPVREEKSAKIGLEPFKTNTNRTLGQGSDDKDIVAIKGKKKIAADRQVSNVAIHSQSSRPRRNDVKLKESKADRLEHHMKKLAAIKDTENKIRRDKSEKEENVFLKRVIEAKKLGVFDDKEEKVVKEQPRTSQDNKEYRTKGEKHLKTKTRKPIIELDEEVSDNDRRGKKILKIPIASHDVKEHRIKAGKCISKSKRPIIEIEEEAGDSEQLGENTSDSKKRANRKPVAKNVVERQDSSSSVWSDKIPVITISKTSSNENILDKEGVEENCKNHQKIKKHDEELPREDSGQNSQRKFIFSDSNDDSSDEDPKSLTTYLDKLNESTGFRPRVKCLLRKQATAIDEDAIIHFGGDLERIEAEKQMILDLVNTKIAETRGFAEGENLPATSRSVIDIQPKLESGSASDRSTSEDTEMKEDDNSVDTILNYPYHSGSDRERLSANNDRSSSVESPVELELEGAIEQEHHSEDLIEDYSEALELQRFSSSRSQTE